MALDEGSVMEPPLVVTIILNHPRGWGGKPTGSHRDSRVAEISQIFGPGFFVHESGRDRKEVGRTHNYSVW
jgi:hypothetical protein